MLNRLFSWKGRSYFGASGLFMSVIWISWFGELKLVSSVPWASSDLSCIATYWLRRRYRKKHTAAIVSAIIGSEMVKTSGNFVSIVGERVVVDVVVVLGTAVVVVGAFVVALGANLSQQVHCGHGILSMRKN